MKTDTIGTLDAETGLSGKASMKIMIIVGARPNFMKAAPLIAAIRGHNEKAALHADPSAPESQKIQAMLVHTGQHYDESMSGSFFVDLGLPRPDISLGIGSASHAVQTAEIMKRFEEVLLREKPEVLIVVGDVNSTLGCALVAAKISYDASGKRPLIAHVEAGLRSGDRDMPEEVNRIVTDHLSDLLFVTEESGARNLLQEGVPQERIHFVGNTMIDSLLASQEKASRSGILESLGLRNASAKSAAAGGSVPQPYALLTLHRPSNVDHRETFLSILEGLKDLAASRPIFFSAHPRTRKRIREFGLESYFQFENGNPASNGIHLLEPVGYLDFLCLMKHASLVVTDSGGIQEETTGLGVPCITVRENTERPVTVTCGTNTIAGTRSDNIREAIQAHSKNTRNARVPEKWDGRAGTRIIEAILLESAKPKN